MIRNALRALPMRSLFVGWVLLGMSVATGSGVLAAPPVSAPASDAAGPAPSSPQHSQILRPNASSLSDLESFTPAETLGAQTINPGRFVNGAATIRAAGANFVRMIVRWSDLAPTDIDPVDYNWTAYDNAMNEAVSQGYQVLIELDHNPSWAASFERGPIDCVPLSRFTDFVTAVVTRYGAAPYNVRYWEVYNEPDSSSGTWSSPDCSGDTEATSFGDHPAEYVTTLAAAHDAIKAVNSDNVVVMSGIAYDWFTTDGGVFVQSFLDDILTDGAASYFDVMNFHFYPHLEGRWETQTGLPGVRAKTAVIQGILDNHGVDKPIICTELGDSSGDIYRSGLTEDTQAIQVVRQFTESIAAGNKISIWYLMTDYGYADFYAEFGLLDYPGYTPKLAVSAYSTLATALNGYDFVRVLGTTELGATDLEGYLFWNQAADKTLTILWSMDGSDQTITLPSGVTSVVDKIGDPVSHTTTLDINQQPVLITGSNAFSHQFLPLADR